MALTKQISRNSLVLVNTDAEVSTAQTLAPYYDWRINGELTLPVETPLDGLRTVDAEFLIHQVRVAARISSTSQYRVRIINKDVNGLNPRVLVDHLFSFINNDETYLLPIADALVNENSVLEVLVQEQLVSASGAEDVSITIIGEDFSELTPLRNGHIIQDQSGSSFPQRENLRFEGAQVEDDLGNDTTLVRLLPVGTYMQSMLTEVQFQAEAGSGWVLADGRSVVGSRYETITGSANIPDARGTFLRSKNNGRADGNQNPDGDLTLGQFTGDAIRNITGQANIIGEPYGIDGSASGAFNKLTGFPNDRTPQTTNTDECGAIQLDASNVVPTAADNRPKNITVNTFIKIN